MVIEVSLPKTLRLTKYVTNHHYLKLSDDDGSSTTLHGTELFVGQCTTAHCAKRVFAEERVGAMLCPHCGLSAVVWFWDKPQLAFVPQKQSDYKAPPKSRKRKRLDITGSLEVKADKKD